MAYSGSKRICLITGGTGGIGWHLCEAFHQEGYQVVALDHRMHRPLSEGIRFIPVDLRSESEIKSVFDAVATDYGAAHVLINNGAVTHFSRPITEMAVSEFDDVIAVNLRGSFICSKAFIAANQGESYGRIINIASTRWHQNEAHWEAYGASKGGLVSLSNSLTVSLTDTPITVNTISPGWIQSENYDALSEGDHKQHPSGRVGIPRDIANACLFLAHVENDFINGCHMVIDGGMTKRMIYG